MDRYDQLCAYLRENIEYLNLDGCTGGCPNYPSYDLYPIDYLKYAEAEINLYKDEKSDRNLINCILHLRRALDCQMDIFLHVFNLLEIFKRHNLGITSKLTFLMDIDVLNSRVFNRFNLLRNKIEHSYQIPQVDDIEVYFDLISSLISNIELSILAITLHEEVIFCKGEADEKFQYDEYLTIGYVFNEFPKINIHIGDREKDVLSFEVSAKDYEVFTKLFRVMFLMIRKGNFVSENIILDKLGPN
jgi:hypothetical protein